MTQVGEGIILETVITFSVMFTKDKAVGTSLIEDGISGVGMYDGDPRQLLLAIVPTPWAKFTMQINPKVPGIALLSPLSFSSHLIL